MTADELETYWKLLTLLRSEISEIFGHTLIGVRQEAVAQRLTDKVLAFLADQAHNGQAR